MHLYESLSKLNQFKYQAYGGIIIPANNNIQTCKQRATL